MTVVNMQTRQILCASGVESAYGILWGGIDDDGVLDPD